MRTKSLLNLIVYFQTICALSWTTFTTTNDPLLIIENLVISSKSGPKTLLKSRHSQQSLKPTIFDQRMTNHDMNSDQHYQQKESTKGKERRKKKKLNTTLPVEIIPFHHEINLLRIAEHCFIALIPQLEELDLRIQRLYKATKRRRLFFFDGLLLKTQRFVNYLLNSAHEESGVLNETANKLNWIPPYAKKSKLFRWKPVVSFKYVSELLSSAESLKKRIVDSIRELNETLDEFVGDFNIKEEKTDGLLIHSDNTIELNE